MKPEKTHIDHIKSEFAKMQTKEDLLMLMNQVKIVMYGDGTVPFDLKQLTWYANPKFGANRYKVFKIKKKSGEYRTIHAPRHGLKSIQKVISFILQSVFEPHISAMGFVRNKSIVDNARRHEGSRYVYNIDLKDFFTSIDQARVWKCLQLNPFNLNSESANQVKIVKWDEFINTYPNSKYLQRPISDLSAALKGFNVDYLLKDQNIKFYKKNKNWFAYCQKGIITASANFIKNKDYYVAVSQNISNSKNSQEYNYHLINNPKAITRLIIANTLASICCTVIEVNRLNNPDIKVRSIRNVLPQGAPTSPVITNIICQRLDLLLSGVAKRFGLKYSRYADDITFSSMHNVYQNGSEFIIEIKRIITEQGFQINENKTRLQKKGYRQEVTGLIVNEKVNVQQRYIKSLRMWLYYWERYGYEKAYTFFLKQYSLDKGKMNKGIPNMIHVISGKLEFLKMVKGSDNNTYRTLLHRFNAVASPNNQQLQSISTNTIESAKIQSKIPNSPIIHNPKALVSLLSKFSENNHILKYSCHSWDFGQIEGKFENYVEFIKLLQKDGKPICFKIQYIKKELGTKILTFLFSVNSAGYYIDKEGNKKEYKWGEYSIKFGWNSSELADWAAQHPHADPFEFEIPGAPTINDIKLSKFKDIIKAFKAEIEIRKEQNQLKEIMFKLKKQHLGMDFKVTYENLEGKQFYTDVHYFKRALNKVFLEIGKRTMYSEVVISAKDNIEEKYTEVIIVHKSSFCRNTKSIDMLAEVQDGDFSDIKNYLTNLCDWYIESSFEDGDFRINYLSSSSSNKSIEEIQSALGFKHVFKFYKQ